MRRRAFGSRVPGVVLTLVLVSASFGRAVDPDASRFMPVDEIRAGMKGFGLTVFAGTRIDSFEVEILGIERNAGPQQDLIWARMAGGPLEHTGIIAGMSGSPVYLDGRLIGAVAYGFRGAKEPLCGISPIAQMLTALERQKGQEGASGRKGRGSSDVGPRLEIDWGLEPGAVRSGSHPGWSLDRETMPEELRGLAGGGTLALVPLATPLMVAGMGPGALPLVAPVLERLGFLPLEAGGTAGGRAESPELEPGAAVGVQFMRGDMSLHGTGTVTYRNGDDLLAFGHPMDFLGQVDMPMVSVHIPFVVPSIVWSFKFSSAIETVGTVTQDRASAISGKVGPVPAMTPMEIRVQEGEGGRDFRYELMRGRDFTPTLAMIAVFSTIGAAGKLSGDYAIGLQAKVTIEGQRSLSVRNLFSSRSAPMETALAVGRPLAQLLHSNFAEVALESISVELSLLEERRQAILEGMRLDKSVVRPGEELAVTLFVRPHWGESTTQTVSLRVPEDAPAGVLEVRAYDARTVFAMEHRRAPERFRPANLAEVIDLLEQTPRNNELVVDLFARRIGATVGAAELPSLPASMLTVLQTARHSGQSGWTQGSIAVRQRIPLDYVVSGSTALSIEVDPQAR